MNIEYHKTFSAHLNHEMEFKIYGHAGKPVVVFPAQGGRFYDFENFGMIEAASWFIEQGWFQFYTPDSIDNQSWANWQAHPADRARRHEDYDRYISRELAPFIRSRTSPETMLLTTGCSMGGYHSANFFFRHPELFDSVISLSGLFQLRMFVGEFVNDDVYLNSPLLYLPRLADPWFLEKYQRSLIIICAGSGAWEDAMLADISVLGDILNRQSIPAWIDIWGRDVNHDWPWWRKQLPYFLGKVHDWERGKSSQPG
jgi:esterase/lipase superfamily enzyme